MAAGQAAVLLFHLNEEAGFFFVVVVASLCSLLLLPFLLRRFSARDDDDDDKLLSRLPSPPNRLPVIGHLHLMGSLPHVSMAALAAKHGPDLMLLRLGAVPTVVASSPRAAEAILRTHDHVFASRPRSMVADIIMYGQSDSCYAPYGDHFRKTRKLVTVHLLSSKKVQAYRPAREEEVGLVMAKLAAGKVDAVVDVTELLHSFANDLICRAVSGKFFLREEEGRNSLFRELIDTNAALLGGFNLEDYFPAVARLWPLSVLICAQATRVSRRWDNLLDKLIDDHAAARRRDGGVVDDDDAEQDDFIDVLLSLEQEYGLTRNHIKANLIDIFEAGTDTLYLALEIAMVELMRHPRVMAKLQSEVRRSVPEGQQMVTEADLTGMTYLKAVIKETLRLHSPAPLFIPHLSMDACEIDGYTIPAGVRVIVNGWAISRSSSSWGPDAQEFRPERFMGDDAGDLDVDVDPKGSSKGDCRYLPFGLGRRMCSGIHSAVATLEIMLANLVWRFDWELPPGVTKEDIDMTMVFGLTVHRKEKLFLVPKIP